MLARDVLHQARDAHPSLDQQSTPDVVALRWLATHQQQLLAEIAQWKPDAVHLAQEIDLPLEDFAEGEAIEPRLLIHGGTVHFTSAQRPPCAVRFVDYPLRLDRYALPAAYVRADTLFLLGDVADWTDVARLVLDLFPRGDEVLTRASELVLPGQAMGACAGPLAAFMAGRLPEPVTVPDPAGALTLYLDAVTGRRRAKVSQIREVW